MCKSPWLCAWCRWECLARAGLASPSLQLRGPRSKLLNQKSESPKEAREVGMGGTWRDSSFVQCLVRGPASVQSGGWVKGESSMGGCPHGPLTWWALEPGGPPAGRSLHNLIRFSTLRFTGRRLRPEKKRPWPRLLSREEAELVLGLGSSAVEPEPGQ